MPYKKLIDLRFTEHSSPIYGDHATMEFPNVWGVSVLRGSRGMKTDDDGMYELAITYAGQIDRGYHPFIGEYGVASFASAEDVNDFMREIQDMPPKSDPKHFQQAANARRVRDAERDAD